MKKRNKKYVPLVQKQEKALRSKMGQTYEFDMQFVIEEVNEKIEAWRTENDMPEDAYCPEWLVIQTYEQQDLIIALKMQQLQSPTYWEVGIDGHFWNAEKEDVYTIPFYIELPEMNHEQLMNGCDVKINRGAGIKTRWKGLQTEMLDHWHEVGCPDGYDLIKSQAYLKAQAKFKSPQMLLEHEAMLKWRDEGLLIARLKAFGRVQVAA